MFAAGLFFWLQICGIARCHIQKFAYLFLKCCHSSFRPYSFVDYADVIFGCLESSRKAYIKNKRKLDMLAEGALNFSTTCKVRRLDCIKDDEACILVHWILEEVDG